jgi:hypothetical protein
LAKKTHELKQAWSTVATNIEALIGTIGKVADPRGGEDEKGDVAATIPPP